MLSTRIRSHRRRNRKPKGPFVAVETLDKKDEIWCYVLVRLFTSLLENPEEAERLLKPNKSCLDVDLAPAVQELKAAIMKRKSQTSQMSLPLRINSQSSRTKNANVPPTAELDDSSDETSGDSSTEKYNKADLQRILKKFMNSLGHE